VEEGPGVIQLVEDEGGRGGSGEYTKSGGQRGAYWRTGGDG